MTKWISAIALVVCFSTSIPAEDKPAAGGEKFVLYKLTDHAKRSSYEVASVSEFRKLKAEIDQEGRLFGRAVSLAEREWKANKDNKGSFPRSAASPRDVREVGTYNDMAAAQAKQGLLQERDAKADENKKKSAAGKQKDKDKAAKEAQREAERQMIADGVIALVEGKLKELKEQAAGGGENKAEPAKAEPAKK